MVRGMLAAAVAAMATLVAGQSSSSSAALPDVTAPAGMACGGCYVVADVAGILFGGIVTQTQTNVVVTGNGSQVVTLLSTSIAQGQAQATFVNGEPLGPGIVTSFGALGSLITVGGATLTSPTQYELFTAFSVISTVTGDNGQCVVTTGSRSVLDVAASYTVPANPPSDYLLQLESSFIHSIGFPECSPGGSNVQSTVHSQVTTTTASVTTNSAPQTAKPAAATTAAASTYVVPNATLNPSFPSITPASAADRSAAPWGSAAALVVALGVLAVWL